MPAFRSSTSVLVVAALSWAAAASADPIKLRIATAAPEGTAWAREFHAFTREVDRISAGQVQVKWYFGGVSGDEVETIERIRRGQLDGVASGGMACNRLAPSMRVLRVLGLFQSREESAYVVGRLRPKLEEESHRAGFEYLGGPGLGSDVLLSRKPIRDLKEFSQLTTWYWDLDQVLADQLPRIGLHVAALPLTDGARAYDEKRIDALIAIPSAAVAFQWSSQTRYITDLRMSFLNGCLIIANRSWDQVPPPTARAIRDLAARVFLRMESLGAEQDHALVSGLFQRQGMERVPVTEVLRTQFFEAARASRAQLPEALVPGR